MEIKMRLKSKVNLKNTVLSHAASVWSHGKKALMLDDEARLSVPQLLQDDEVRASHKNKCDLMQKGTAVVKPGGVFKLLPH